VRGAPEGVAQARARGGHVRQRSFLPPPPGTPWVRGRAGVGVSEGRPQVPLTLALSHRGRGVRWNPPAPSRDPLNIGVTHTRSGRTTIRKQDVVKPQGIVLKVKDGYKILHAEIIQRNASENNFDTTSSQDKTQATLTFEYIDRNEGVVIQIFHTGLKDEDIEVVGKVMAAGSPQRMFIPHPSLAPQKTRPKYSRKRDQAIGIGMILFPFVISLLIRFLPLEDRRAEPVQMTPTQWVIVLTVLFGLS